MAGTIDVTPFIGQVHEVTVDAGANVRTMTVTVGDGGPLPWWDHRQVLSLTVQFTDGKRSHWASADAAAGQVAEKIFAPFSVGTLGGDGWEPKITRTQRDTGRKRNGSTMFTFYVFAGPDESEMRQRIAADKKRLAAVAAELGMTV